MNKYQRAKSRRIKAHMRAAKELGEVITYKEAKRRIRILDRTIDRLKPYFKRVNKAVKTMRYGISGLGRVISNYLNKPHMEIKPLANPDHGCDGLRAHFTAIDELSTDQAFAVKPDYIRSTTTKIGG